MTQIHLLVIIHGLWGNPEHVGELDRIVREAHGDREKEGVRLHVLLAKTNSEDSTYDGVDWGGERVAREVKAEVAALKEAGEEVVKFSVTGYSMGGLVARYLIGVLHQQGFFKVVTPVNFNTFATPHIGLPKYPTLVSALGHSLGKTMLSRSGKQFLLVDEWSKSGRPLLEVLADPSHVFYQGLALFQHLRVYANAVNDVTVPYPSAVIEGEDPFVDHKTNGMHIELHETYAPLIKRYTRPLRTNERPSALAKSWRSLKLNSNLQQPRTVEASDLSTRVLVYTALPVLLPILVPYVLTKVHMAAKTSKARIKLLEEDADLKDSLFHIFTATPDDSSLTSRSDTTDAGDPSPLPRPPSEVVDAAISEAISAINTSDAISEQTDSSSDEDTLLAADVQTLSLTPTTSEGQSPSSSTPSLDSTSKKKGCRIKAKSESRDKKKEKEKEKARCHRIEITDPQQKIVQNLNKLPIQKERAFFPSVGNSHAYIICREVKRFENQRAGEGVIRHWADNFIL
ncbi:hypothetical protein AX16_006584 [Volvariella volvacea WC 439]|nr:hypothetical protein AX16_006584 [Volvariella volvacea WC 439]